MGSVGNQGGSVELVALAREKGAELAHVVVGIEDAVAEAIVGIHVGDHDDQHEVRGPGSTA